MILKPAVNLFCVYWNKNLAKVKSPLSIRKMPYWSSDQVLHWLKKNCKSSYELYGLLFKEHCITGRSVTTAVVMSLYYKKMLMYWHLRMPVAHAICFAYFWFQISFACSQNKCDLYHVAKIAFSGQLILRVITLEVIGQ